jgi:protein-tyrosine phosphatase
MNDRRVELQGAFNFRDLGGIGTADGATVARGQVYRSDALHRLTPGDALVLERIGIGRVFDLRSASELRKDGVGDFCRNRHVHVPLVEETLSAFDPDIDWSRIDLGMRYLEMLSVGGHAIRALVEAAADGSGPIVFHCTAGKDRTGVVAAVLLRALGVADETIVADYALSEVYMRAALDGYRRELLARRFAPDVVAYLSSSPPERMRATLRELDRRWGSTAAYLETIGVGGESIARLKDCCLLR